jgi:hypothetical protein
MRTLSADWKSTTMPQTSVTTEIHQALDAHGNITTQITFNAVAVSNYLTDLNDILIGQLVNPHRTIDLRLGADLVRCCRANSVDVR